MKEINKGRKNGPIISACVQTADWITESKRRKISCCDKTLHYYSVKIIFLLCFGQLLACNNTVILSSRVTESFLRNRNIIRVYMGIVAIVI